MMYPVALMMGPAQVTLRMSIVGPISLLDAQKLSLPANTAVGTQVSVTDGFVVANDPQGDNGFYYESGEIANGKPKCVHYPPNIDQDIFWDTSSNNWINALGVFSNLDVAHFWLATDSHADHDGYTLTHPAIQQLTAPSTAQGGVFVSGGTQDEVYTDSGFTVGGKAEFRILGWVDDDTHSIINWTDGHWGIGNNADGATYYSLSNVATPDLATNWKNASDNSPASITVTSVTQGQLVSGWKLGSVVYAVNGAQNGRNLYHDVLGVATDIGWTGVHWTDGTTTGTLNTAFPDIGTVDAVASEANWQIVP